jgi:hypothetical protein
VGGDQKEKRGRKGLRISNMSLALFFAVGKKRNARKCLFFYISLE